MVTNDKMKGEYYNPFKKELRALTTIALAGAFFVGGIILYDKTTMKTRGDYPNETDSLYQHKADSLKQDYQNKLNKLEKELK